MLGDGPRASNGIIGVEAAKSSLFYSGFNPFLDAKRVQERFPLFFGVTTEPFRHFLVNARMPANENLVTGARMIGGGGDLTGSEVYPVVIGLR